MANGGGARGPRSVTAWKMAGGSRISVSHVEQDRTQNNVRKLTTATATKTKMLMLEACCAEDDVLAAL